MSDLTVTKPSEEPIVVMTRLFDAPRERIFRAYTDPALMARWWGPHGFTIEVCELNVRPGGAWRIHHRAPDGSEYRFKGQYREVAEPERLVSTFGMDGMFEDKLIVDSLTLEEKDGRTRLTAVSRFESMADRDAMLETGMEEGAGQSFDRLADLLRTFGRDASDPHP